MSSKYEKIIRITIEKNSGLWYAVNEVVYLSELSKRIGERIRQDRVIKGLTQSELAEKLGKTLRTVQKYESGEIEPSLDTISQVNQILDINLFLVAGYVFMEVNSTNN